MVKTFYFDGQKSLSYVIHNFIIFGQSDRSRRRQQIKSKSWSKFPKKFASNEIGFSSFLHPVKMHRPRSFFVPLKFCEQNGREISRQYFFAF